MFLLMVFLLLMIVLSVAIYALAIFFQSYLYTAPIAGLAWRAPVAAAVITTYYVIWAYIVVSSDVARGIPYDVIHRFSPRVSMFESDKPAPELYAVQSGGTRTTYFLRKTGNAIGARIEYQDGKGRPYDPLKVVAIELKDPTGAMVTFERQKSDDGGSPVFRTADGWELQEFPNGEPERWRLGRFFGNLFLNLVNGILWLLCLWLVLQFRFNDALGFSIVLWLVTTLALPVVLDEAAARARTNRPSATVTRPTAFANVG